MKKIAIFAEGQTELIFLRNFFLRVMDPSKLSFECYELLGQKPCSVPYLYGNPNAEIHFLIVDVGGDEKVLSSIRDREEGLIKTGGYEKIIGLRDMYGDKYRKHSPGVINGEISEMIIERANQTIKGMMYFDRIKLCFAIMEIEAWFLGMYNLFQKIDSLLTIEYIKLNLDIDLKSVDPQKEFFKPSDKVKSIFHLCGRKYEKRRDEVESICSNMDSFSLDNATENNRCMSFADFYEEITSCS